MNGFSFTERLRKVLISARDEAERRNHEFIGTEHLLLGIMKGDEGVAAVALQNLNVNLDEIQRTIDGIITNGNAAVPAGRELPYTSRSQKALQLAMSEAGDLNQIHVGTEHLLLGLIQEGKGIAAQVLNHAGLTREAARTEIRRLMGLGDDRADLRDKSFIKGIGMDEKALFTKFWTNEAKTTHNVLARIPEGSDYRPDPKSRTAQEIAWQIVCEEKMIIDALESGKAEWAPPKMPATMKEVLDAYDTQSEAMATRWNSLPAERWNGKLEFFGGERPASPMAWSFLFDIVHHRGQITTYLRPMGSKVPQVYGPSGDEP